MKQTESSHLKVAIIGAGGFTGRELLRLIGQHPGAEVIRATSAAYEGKPVADVFPVMSHLYEKSALRFTPHPETARELSEADVVFTATPDTVSMKYVPECHDAGIRVIDIAGAFRLPDPRDFETNYGIPHTASSLLKQAVYGLPEINRADIAKATIVANPGCYPSSALLSIAPISSMLNEIQPTRIIIDGKSGTSGAGGRSEKDNLTFSSVNENFRAYKIERHQHEIEMEVYARKILSSNARVRFTPYLLPLFRGILTTVYISLDSLPSEEKIAEAMRNFIEQEPFLRFVSDPNAIQLSRVQNTNFADIGFYIDRKNELLILFSAIDNLLKGAAGTAIQNMNIMFDLPETSGLEF